MSLLLDCLLNNSIITLGSFYLCLRSKIPHYFALIQNSLHEEGVSHDVALAISLVADAYTFKNSSDFKIVSWENEVISSKHGRDSILSITEHSESYLQVGIKLLQFCERENLIDTPQYKALFKSLEAWNSKLKGKE